MFVFVKIRDEDGGAVERGTQEGIHISGRQRAASLAGGDAGKTKVLFLL